ncbi:unnamed protein product, partial [Closterium sp. NIES-53]
RSTSTQGAHANEAADLLIHTGLHRLALPARQRLFHHHRGDVPTVLEVGVHVRVELRQVDVGIHVVEQRGEGSRRLPCRLLHVVGSPADCPVTDSSPVGFNAGCSHVGNVPANASFAEFTKFGCISSARCSIEVAGILITWLDITSATGNATSRRHRRCPTAPLIAGGRRRRQLTQIGHEGWEGKRRGMSTGVVEGPVLAWTEPTLWSGAGGAATCSSGRAGRRGWSTCTRTTARAPTSGGRQLQGGRLGRLACRLVDADQGKPTRVAG